MQNRQKFHCVIRKEEDDPENDKAAPKDVSLNTSLTKRNMHTFWRSAPFSGVTPAACWPIQQRHSDGAHCRNEKVKPSPPLRSSMIKEIRNFLNAPLQLSPQIKSFTSMKVRLTTAANANSKKVPGKDLINGKIIKELPRKGIALIASIFNEDTFAVER